jgi:hypothetical protein
VPLGHLQQLLGHEKVETTMIYARFAPAYGASFQYFDAFAQEMGKFDVPIIVPAPIKADVEGDA